MLRDSGWVFATRDLILYTAMLTSHAVVYQGNARTHRVSFSLTHPTQQQTGMLSPMSEATIAGTGYHSEAHAAIFDAGTENSLSSFDYPIPRKRKACLIDVSLLCRRAVLVM